jgi:putative oxygen-independent coproporphyrinogen III oxidase
MHLYVHVPFCARRCSYCDFSIAVRRRVPAREYVECVRRELELVRAGPDGGDASPSLGRRPEALDTLYLGGGTPSRLPGDAVAALLAALLGAFPRTDRETIEITLEANPEDVTPAAARAWRRAGINRVSLGAQSFDERVLRWMHRAHDGARIGAAVHALAGAGIDNVSLDLIFALPAALERDWDRDLALAAALGPAHLSLYGLTVEPRTPLARWVARGAAVAPDDERYAAEYLLAHERLVAAGYHFYEVSNAARERGARSRHNSAYWSGQPYLGLGPAAHSYDGRARRWNLAGWERYREAVAAGRSPVESTEPVSGDARELERLYLSLRTAEGLALAALSPRAAPLAAWERAGWVQLRHGRLVCTPEGWLRLDALVGDLTRPDVPA